MWGKRPLPICVLGPKGKKYLVSEYPEIPGETTSFILILCQISHLAPASPDKAYQSMQIDP